MMGVLLPESIFPDVPHRSRWRALAKKKQFGWRGNFVRVGAPPLLAALLNYGAAGGGVGPTKPIPTLIPTFRSSRWLPPPPTPTSAARHTSWFPIGRNFTNDAIISHQWRESSALDDHELRGETWGTTRRWWITETAKAETEKQRNADGVGLGCREVRSRLFGQKLVVRRRVGPVG